MSIVPTISELRICFVGLENIAVLSPEYGHDSVGGEQVQQTLLARAFRLIGTDVSMITRDYGQPDGFTHDGIVVYKTYAPGDGIPVLRYVHPRLTGLWSALKRADAQIYYTSCAGMHVGVLAAFAKRYGRKLVFRIAHDTDCDPSRLLIRHRRDRWLYAYGIKNADTVLAQSNQQVEMLCRNFGIEAHIAGMLVDFPHHILPPQERDIEILWVNNLRPFKRPDLALELAKALPDHQLHMIGGALPPFEALHREILAASAEVRNVTFHGKVPYHLVNRFYDRARIFVNTSDSEGFPNSYLQAWARGVPVVTFFDPDGVIAANGLGATVCGLDAMRDAVASLSSDPERWQAASERCRAFMHEHYRDEIILPSYRRVFEDLG